MMANSKAPLVDIEGLHADGYPVLVRIGSDAWVDWLERNSKFRFECGSNARFTAYKSSKGYWTAQRRYNGKLRHEYLGVSRQLGWDKLERIARKLDMRDGNYWREKYPSPVPARDSMRSLSLTQDYETGSSDSSQANKDRVTREMLAEVIRERDTLLTQCQTYQKRIEELELIVSERNISVLGVG
jgi:hypothetical protein